MPTLPGIERLDRVKATDSQAVKTWREKARYQAMSALSLAGHAPDYVVLGARNTKSLLGLVAFRDGEDVQIVHFATRDTGKDITGMLIDEVVKYADGRRIRSFKDYANLKWRKVGKEYWSK